MGAKKLKCCSWRYGSCLEHHLLEGTGLVLRLFDAIVAQDPVVIHLDNLAVDVLLSSAESGEREEFTYRTELDAPARKTLSSTHFRKCRASKR